MKKLLSILLLALFALSVARCSQNLGGVTEIGNPPTALSEIESSLYEDGGVVSIPVTIAKLESVDVDKLTVEYSAASASAQLIKSALYQSAAETNTYDITGSADTVDYETTPYLMAVSDTTNVTVDVAEDGSFSVSIPVANEGDQVALLPLSADQQYGAPPVFPAREEHVDVYAMTDSADINIYQFLVVDDDRNMYFSALYDGNYNLYSRNLDGTDVETVAVGITSPPIYVSVSSGRKVAFVTMDGKVYVASTATAATSSSLVKNSDFPVRYDVVSWLEPTVVKDFGGTLDQYLISPIQAPPPIGISFVGEDGLFIYNQKSIGESIAATHLLNYIDLNTGTEYPQASVLDYYDAHFAKGGQDTLYVFASQAEEAPWKLGKINLADGALAFDNRTQLINLGDDRLVQSMTASQTGHILFNANGHLYQASEASLVPDAFLTLNNPEYIFGAWFIANPQSTIGSGIVYTCATERDQDQWFLIALNFDADGNSEAFRLVNAETSNTCAGSYDVTGDQRLVFYSAYYNDDGTAKNNQVSLINLFDLESSSLEPFEEFAAPE